MLNWIVKNRTVWIFYCLYHIFNVYRKTGFGIKYPTMVDLP